MVRFTVLASGSRGNSTLIATERTRLLVDAGLSCRELLKRMREAGENPESLNGIVITHEHQDHVQGLAVLARKLNIPVYFTEATHRAWVRWMTPQKRVTYAEWLARHQAERAAKKAREETADSSGRYDGLRNDNQEGIATEARGPDAPPMDLCEDDVPAAKKPRDAAELSRLPAVEYFRAGKMFTVGDIDVYPFTIPHDAIDPVGFVFRAEGVKLAVATDLGYMPPNAREVLRGCDVLMIESNHDLEMLRDGPYPWSVKQRVMSRVGHLSNHALAEWLAKDYDGAAQYVVLAHLSANNNLPELARLAAEAALRDRTPLFCNRLVLAEQDAPLAAITL